MISQRLKTFLPWLIVIVLCVTLIAKYNYHPVEPNVAPIKQRIVTETKQDDSIQLRIVYKDRLRTEHVHHYHEIRRDSIIPCEDKLVVADTVIVIDSSEIASLKADLFVKQLIIADQDTIIKKDSVVIHRLNNKLRRTRFIARVCAIGAAIGIGTAIVR